MHLLDKLILYGKLLRAVVVLECLDSIVNTSVLVNDFLFLPCSNHFKNLLQWCFLNRNRNFGEHLLMREHIVLIAVYNGLVSHFRSYFNSVYRLQAGQERDQDLFHVWPCNYGLHSSPENVGDVLYHLLED